MVFSVIYTICEGLSWMLGRLKLSYQLIANTIPYINKSNFRKRNFIYIVTFSVAHWDAWDDSLSFEYVSGEYY